MRSVRSWRASRRTGGACTMICFSVFIAVVRAFMAVSRVILSWRIISTAPSAVLGMAVDCPASRDRPADPAPTARVFGGRTPQQLGRRFTAAAAAGLPGRLTAHSGRVGRASELTARGASTTAVMRAGAWKTARMVSALQRRGPRGTRGGRALPVAPGATGRPADGRAGRQPAATAPRARARPANKQDAWRGARSPLNGGGCPGHRTPRPGGSPSPPPVGAGTNRARGGGPGAARRDRAGRLVERAAIARGSRAGRPAGRRRAVSAAAARRVTPPPPSAGGPQRSRGGRTTRRRSRRPGHRAARASPASAPGVRRLPDRSAARAAGRCPAGLTRHIIRPDEGGWGGWPTEDLPPAPRGWNAAALHTRHPRQRHK